MTMLSRFAQSLVPYKAGEQPRDKRYIKLNTNENPYPPSPKVAATLASFAAGELRLYPDPSAVRLRDAIAAREGVKRENVFVGNGSDEVLAFAFAALFAPDRTVAFADVTYSFYPVYCDFFGLAKKIVPLDADFKIDRRGYENAGGAVIANPNAPTAVYEDVSEFIGKKYPVIIDEAYIDFSSAPSLARAAANGENAVVVKTFSKSYSLAGARCGYAVANEEIVNGLFAVKDSFNSYTVNALTQAMATAAVSDREYHAETVAKVVATRERLRGKLLEKGYLCPESAANFLCVSVPNGDGEGLYKRLKENGVLVRWFPSPRLKDKLRITVGTDEDADALLKLM